jgi:hypothetical protein
MISPHHQGQPPQVDQYQNLPPIYDSRKMYACKEPNCHELFDHPNTLRLHQR